MSITVEATQAGGTVTPWEAVQVHRALQERLPMWTITARPKDPHGFVARLHLTLPQPEATNVALVATTLEALRELIPQGLAMIPRAPSDDPVIVETWL